MNKNTIAKTFLTILITATLSGCGGIGMIAGGKTQTFTGTDTIELSVPKPNILDIISEVGQSMEMSLSSIDKKAGQISFQNSSAPASAILIGKGSYVGLTVIVKNNGKTLDIQIMTTGNFGSGTKEAADKIIEDFKTRLNNRLKK